MYINTHKNKHYGSNILDVSFSFPLNIIIIMMIFIMLVTVVEAAIQVVFLAQSSNLETKKKLIKLTKENKWKNRAYKKSIKKRKYKVNKKKMLNF